MPTLDDVYADRNHLVLLAVMLAEEAGWETGLIVDPPEPDWPVLAIVGPTGQMSWHVPRSLLDQREEPPLQMEGDGHADVQKAERLMAWVRDWWPWGPVAGDEDDGAP